MSEDSACGTRTHTHTHTRVVTVTRGSQWPSGRPLAASVCSAVHASPPTLKVAVIYKALCSVCGQCTRRLVPTSSHPGGSSGSWGWSWTPCKLCGLRPAEATAYLCQISTHKQLLAPSPGLWFGGGGTFSAAALQWGWGFWAARRKNLPELESRRSF